MLSLAYSQELEAQDRISVAEALIKVGQLSKAVEALSYILSDPSVSHDQQINAAKKLGEHRQVEKAMTALLSLLNNESVQPPDRIRAAKELAELNHANDVIQFLISFASDSTRVLEHRTRAAKLLSELGRSSEATSILIMMAAKLFSSSQDFFLITQTLIDIGQTKEASNVLWLIASNDNTESTDRLKAAEDLLRVGDLDKATHILANLMNDVAVLPLVRLKAANVLKAHKRINDAGLTSLLLSLVRDEKVASRFEDLWSKELVTQLEQLVGVENLVTLARDPEVIGWVRYRIALALRRQAQFNEAYTVILSLACNESLDERLRRNDIDRLEMDSRVQEMLMILRDSTLAAWVRLWAADALQSNWFRDTTPNKYELAGEVASTLMLLVHTASGEDAWVRGSAISSLKTENRVDELLALAGDQSISKDLRLLCMESVEELNKQRVLTKLVLPALQRLANEDTEIEIRSAAQRITTSVVDRRRIDEEDPFSN
jgi:thioredoxin-like negative regulator of GroEL